MNSTPDLFVEDSMMCSQSRSYVLLFWYLQRPIKPVQLGFSQTIVTSSQTPYITYA